MSIIFGFIVTYLCVRFVNWFFKVLTGKDTLKRMDRKTLRKLKKLEDKSRKKNK